jgi:ribosomal protein S18 acetylase RimI-like enzyme
MHIRHAEPSDAEPIRQFLIQQGWAHRVGNPEAFEALLRASQRTSVALDQAGAVIGFGRAITDGISNGYLSMVAVDPTHRRQGIGRRLVDHLIGADPGVTWVLRAGREEADAFFRSLGFEISTVAMERRRANAP